jgi:hypothetical protein
MNRRTYTAFLMVVLLHSVATPQTPSKVEKRVSVLIEKMTKNSTEQKAFADIEALGCQAVPAIIRQMDDRRKLPDPRISLRNKSSDAFEGMRFYGPEEVVDALAAILNQITGQDFGSIYNGASEKERSAAVRGWRDFLQKTPPDKLCSAG